VRRASSMVRWDVRTLLVLLLAVAWPAGASAAARPAGPIIGLGNTPYGLAMNLTTDTLYVVNAGSGTVAVVDGRTNANAARIDVGGVPLDVAVNPSTLTVYVTDSRDDTLSVIDGATNAVTATVRVGMTPQGVAVDPTTDRVYVANFYGAAVSVVDGRTNS